MYDQEITATAAQHINNLCEILKDYVNNTTPDFVAENANIIEEIGHTLDFMRRSPNDQKWRVIWQDFAEIFIIRIVK